MLKQVVQSKQSINLSLILTLSAAVLGVISLIGAKRTIGFLGVIHSYPLGFFIALALLTVAAIILWFSDQENEWLALCQWLLLNAAFWMAIQVFGDWLTGGFHTYDWFGFTDYIIQGGHLQPDVAQLWYHAWPGFFLHSAMLMEVLGIDNPDIIIRLAPFVVQIAYLAGLYLFFRNTLGSKYCWIALWLFTLGNWQHQNAWVPQAYTLAIFFIILALFTKPHLWKNKYSSAGYQFILFLLLAAIVVTHMLTALVTLGVMVSLYFTRRYSINTLIILALVTVIVWTLYGSTDFLNANLDYYTVLLSNMVQALVHQLGYVFIERSSSGSESHQVIAIFRILLLLVFGATCIAGATASFRCVKKRVTDLTILAIGVGISIIVFVSGALGSAAGVLLRAYTFVLPVAVYFGAKNFEKKALKGVLSVFVILLVPLHMIAQEGSQPADYMPPGYLEAQDFFYKNTTGGSVSEIRSIAPMDPDAFGGSKNRDIYRQVLYRWPQWEGILESIEKGKFDDDLFPHYVIYTPKNDKSVIYYATGDVSIAEKVQLALVNSMNSYVYNNGLLYIILLHGR